MKATLMFDLPGEQEEFHQASTAGQMASDLYTFREYLRQAVKHNPDKFTDSQLEAVEEVREVFYECCGRWME